MWDYVCVAPSGIASFRPVENRSSMKLRGDYTDEGSSIETYLNSAIQFRLLCFLKFSNQRKYIPSLREKVTFHTNKQVQIPVLEYDTDHSDFFLVYANYQQLCI